MDTRHTALYPRLLGNAWDSLGELVRRCHGGGVRAAGLFDVKRATGLFGGLLCRLMRLPCEGTDLPVRLTVTPQPWGETWHRSFGGSILRTEQRERAGGLLAERIGPLELWFRLEASERALILRQTGAALRLGPLAVPIPGFLAPEVSARASEDRPGRMSVTVVLSAPLIGPILRYEGFVEPEETP